jgi:hypothetical protein
MRWPGGWRRKSFKSNGCREMGGTRKVRHGQSQVQWAKKTFSTAHGRSGQDSKALPTLWLVGDRLQNYSRSSFTDPLSILSSCSKDQDLSFVSFQLFVFGNWKKPQLLTCSCSLQFVQKLYDIVALTGSRCLSYSVVDFIAILRICILAISGCPDLDTDRSHSPHCTKLIGERSP